MHLKRRTVGGRTTRACLPPTSSIPKRGFCVHKCIKQLFLYILTLKSLVDAKLHFCKNLCWKLPIFKWVYCRNAECSISIQIIFLLIIYMLLVPRFSLSMIAIQDALTQILPFDLLYLSIWVFHPCSASFNKMKMRITSLWRAYTFSYWKGITFYI